MTSRAIVYSLAIGTGVLQAVDAPVWRTERAFRVCPRGVESVIEAVATHPAGAPSLLCNVSAYPGAVFMNVGGGTGRFVWTPPAGQEGFRPELRMIAQYGGLSSTQAFTLWVSTPDAPVVDIKGRAWNGRGNDFATSSLDWTLYGVSADSVYLLQQTTWSNRASGAQGVASGQIPFWSLPASALILMPGKNMIIVEAVNDQGNRGMNGIEVTYDTSAPVLQILAPPNGTTFTNATGFSVTGICHDAQTRITALQWSCEPSGARGVPVGISSWSIDGALLDLQHGSNVLTVVATNEAGLAASARLMLFLDDDLPYVVITNPTTAPVYQIGHPYFTLSGYANDIDTPLARVEWYNHTAGLTGVCSGTYAWQVAGTALGLARGSNVIEIAAFNNLGARGSAEILIVYEDATPPSIVITAPTNCPHLTLTTAFMIQGVASDPDGVLTSVRWQCQPGGLSGAASGLEQWSVAVAQAGLQAGTNVFAVFAHNEAGLSATATCVIIYEAVLPFIQITGPTVNPVYYTGHTNFTLNGIAGDDDTPLVRVTYTNTATGAHGTASGLETWTVPAGALGLVRGANVIIASVENTYGVQAHDSIEIQWDDVTPPGITITGPSSAAVHITTTNVVAFAGTASDPQSGITRVTWQVSPSGAGGVAAGTTGWEVPAGVAPLQIGSNLFTATAFNGVGDTATAAQIVIYDPLSVIVRILEPTEAPEYLATNVHFTMAGHVSSLGAITQLSWSNHTQGSGGALPPSNTFAIAATALGLARGTNVIAVYATSGHGLSGMDMLTIILEDRDPPRVRITFPHHGAFLHVTPVTAEGTAYDDGGLLRVELNGRVADGLAQWSCPVTLRPGFNTLTATAYDMPPSLTANDSIIVLYGEPNRNTLTVQIQQPSLSNRWETSSPTANLSGIASGPLGIEQVLWINRSVSNSLGYADGNTTWAVAGLPLQDGENDILIVAYDRLGNWGVDSILITKRPGASNNADIVFTSLRIKKNVTTSVGAGTALRDVFMLKGEIENDIFNQFNVTGPNPDALIITIRYRTVDQRAIVATWNSTERRDRTFWNSYEWRVRGAGKSQTKQTAKPIQINPENEGRLVCKLKRVAGKRGAPPKTTFQIRVMGQKLVGNAVDNTNRLLSDTPVDLWISFGNAHTSSRIMFGEKWVGRQLP